MLIDIHKLALSYIPEYYSVGSDTYNAITSPVSITFKTIPLEGEDHVNAIIDRWFYVDNFEDDLTVSWTYDTITLTGTPDQSPFDIDQSTKVEFYYNGHDHTILLHYINRAKSCQNLNW